MKDGEDYLFIPLNRRKEASNKLVIIINLLVEGFRCEFRGSEPLPLAHPDPHIGFICRTTEKLGHIQKLPKISLGTFPSRKQKLRPPPKHPYNPKNNFCIHALVQYTPPPFTSSHLHVRACRLCSCNPGK